MGDTQWGDGRSLSQIAGMSHVQQSTVTVSRCNCLTVWQCGSVDSEASLPPPLHCNESNTFRCSIDIFKTSPHPIDMFTSFPHCIDMSNTLLNYISTFNLHVQHFSNFNKIFNTLLITLPPDCWKEPLGEPLEVFIPLDPLWVGINRLVFRDCLTALFLIPDFWILKQRILTLMSINKQSKQISIINST